MVMPTSPLNGRQLSKHEAVFGRARHHVAWKDRCKDRNSEVVDLSIAFRKLSRRVLHQTRPTGLCNRLVYILSAFHFRGSSTFMRHAVFGTKLSRNSEHLHCSHKRIRIAFLPFNRHQHFTSVSEHCRFRDHPKFFELPND